MYILSVILPFLLSFVFFLTWGRAKHVKDTKPLSDYVDPNIGFAHSRWFFYTPAAVPFGMAKLSPSTNAYLDKNRLSDVRLPLREIKKGGILKLIMNSQPTDEYYLKVGSLTQRAVIRNSNFILFNFFKKYYDGINPR